MEFFSRENLLNTHDTSKRATAHIFIGTTKRTEVSNKERKKKIEKKDSIKKRKEKKKILHTAAEKFQVATENETEQPYRQKRDIEEKKERRNFYYSIFFFLLSLYRRLK